MQYMQSIIEYFIIIYITYLQSSIKFYPSYRANGIRKTGNAFCNSLARLFKSMTKLKRLSKIVEQDFSSLRLNLNG